MSPRTFVLGNISMPRWRKSILMFSVVFGLYIATYCCIFRVEIRHGRLEKSRTLPHTFNATGPITRKFFSGMPASIYTLLDFFYAPLDHCYVSYWYPNARLS